MSSVRHFHVDFKREIGGEDQVVCFRNRERARRYIHRHLMDGTWYWMLYNNTMLLAEGALFWTEVQR